MTEGKPNSRVLPLPVVQRDARKLQTSQQLREGVCLAKRLRNYPIVPDLSIERCGEGMELWLESPAINPQGWLRAIFWIHEKTRAAGLTFSIADFGGIVDFVGWLS